MRLPRKHRAAHRPSLHSNSLFILQREAREQVLQLFVIFEVGDPVVAAHVYVRAFQVCAVPFRQHDERRVPVPGLFAYLATDAQDLVRSLADEIDEDQIGRKSPPSIFAGHLPHPAPATRDSHAG